MHYSLNLLLQNLEDNGKDRVSLVSSVMSVIKDFEFGEWIFFHYIIIKYILLIIVFNIR